MAEQDAKPAVEPHASQVMVDSDGASENKCHPAFDLGENATVPPQLAPRHFDSTIQSEGGTKPGILKVNKLIILYSSSN